MKKRNKGTIYMALIMLSLVIVLFYLYRITGQINGIKAQTSKVRSEKLSLSRERAASENEEKMFPVNPGTALFVEKLYDAARISGIKKHEVSTEKTGDISVRKNVMKNATGESEKVLKTYSLKISLEGNYRDTAEYIREVQNIGRYMRIMGLVMKPVDKLLKTDITIEIYSLGGRDAAQ
jgi:hypothetical protein